MIKGVRVVSKSKRKKSPGWKEREAEHQAFLDRMGVKGTKQDYRQEREKFVVDRAQLSNTIDNGTLKETNKYTGNEIAGIVVTHKSNLMPIRKDNKQGMIDAANMRR
jgi:hypothetical protein